MDFERYVAQHQRALFRFAVVLCGSPTVADDLVAQVMAVAFEHWERVSAAENVHAYVRRMVVNEYLGWRRRSRRSTPHDDVAELLDRSHPQPDPAEAIADQHLLLAELRRLPRKQRAAVVLRYYEGLPFAQIADLLGSSEVAVRSNLSRALATLRVELDDDAELSLHPTRGRS